MNKLGQAENARNRAVQEYTIKGERVCRLILYTAFVVVVFGCDSQIEPPPFRYDTLEFEADDIRYVYYDVSLSEFSQGRWRLEYEVDLRQEDEENLVELFSYIALPTGERVREVTINSINSPIQGKVYAEQAGRHSLVLGDPPREGMTLIDALAIIAQGTLSSGPKVAVAKTRMYTPCD